MKKEFRLWRLLLLGVICMMIATPVFASSAVKVTTERVYKGQKDELNQQYVVRLTGIDKNGKEVWNYNTGINYDEVYLSTHQVKGKYVYIIDGGKYVRIRLRDGKVLVKKDYGSSHSCPIITIDKKGNLYVTGKFSSKIHKINKNGKVVKTWNVKKSTLQANYSWPWKLKISGKRLIVICSYDGKWRYSVRL